MKGGTAVKVRSGLRPLLLDVCRTDLHSRFFSTFEYEQAGELLDDLTRLPLDYDAFGRSQEAQWSYGYDGWLYWLLFLKGYTQYRASNEVDPSNVYLRYLSLYYAARDPDPIMRSADLSPMVSRIVRRYRDCDQLSLPARAARYAQNMMAPITAYTRRPPAAEDQYRVYRVGARAPIRARLLDGHHRLFTAKLFGVARLRLEILQEPAVIPEVPGRIEDVRFDGLHLRVGGWMEGPPGARCVEIRSRGRTLCRGVLTEGVKPAATTRPQHGFRFTVDAEVPSGIFSIDSLDVMILQRWLPVGKLSTSCRQGLNDRPAAL